MRIATSTIYDNQTASIDNLVAQQQTYGNELSSGKQLNVPSDDPTQIAQDLSLRTSIAQENQASTNITSATAQMTTIDGALSSLSDIMQQARSIAVQGASSLNDPTQLQALANQVNGLLQQAVGLANTTYAGSYVFGGTSASASPPVTTNGQPISGVTFNGNLQTQTEQLYNGDVVPTTLTMQQAFNYNAPDGSPDVFQTLINLRNTLSQGSVTSQSATRVNKANTAFAAATPIDQAGILSTPLTPDANGDVDISITSQQAPNGVTITIPAVSTMSATLAAINAQSAATGVSASFDYKQQRLTLTSASGSFEVADVPSAGSATSGNFVEAFGLQSQANTATDLSQQLGDIDATTQVVLGARATLGGTMQTLSAIGSATSAQVTSDTNVQSGIEDADIAKVMSQFSLSQTALQAAYGTTTRLEQETLFDFLQQ